MSVCSAGVSATQFALLTSLSSVGQRVFGPLAGQLVAHAGWPMLFVAAAVLAVPGIVLARYMPP
jgi:PAT family beta-lactamase induction signal transducer AmpG